MFRRYRRAHRYSAQHVTQPTQTDNYKEAETDAQQRVKQRLHADPVDYKDEEAKAEDKGKGLQPNERSTRVVSGWFRFFGEFLYFTGGPVVCELFSRINQGAALTLLTPKAFANSSPGFERKREPWDSHLKIPINPEGVW